MKIAVTAANGQLGSAIVKQLVSELGTEKIVAIARTPEKAAFLGVESRKGDYRQKEDFDIALKGIDALLIVSANGEPMARIPQHRNIIAAAKETGVRRIVYTSITGDFGLIVKSNRQTEEDIKQSGLEWVIGRNGLYIEPDVEYIETYKKDGKITNSGGDGKCAYCTRAELAYAYSKMLQEDIHHGQTYVLAGESITQAQLTAYMNLGFGTNLTYESMSVEAYKADRIAESGEFMGTVVASIYESIRNGTFDVASDFEQAAGRPHISWQDYFSAIQSNN